MADITTLFGRRLRELRERRGLTQQQLGEMAELGFKYLGSVERGQENPSLRVMIKVSEALGVELRDLFEFEHEETSKTELRKKMDRLLKAADVATLQQAVKLLRSLRS